MNLRLFEDINVGSEDICKAKNILVYSLHLKYHLEKQDELQKLRKNGDVNEFVDCITEQVQEICHPLFYGHVHHWDFFGTEGMDRMKERCFTRIADYLYEFWFGTIKTHCIVSALFTLRSEFGKDMVSAYHFCCYAMEHSFSKYRSNSNYFDENGKRKGSIRSGDSVDNHGKPGPFVKKFKGLIPKIKGHFEGYYTKGIEKIEDLEANEIEEKEETGDLEKTDSKKNEEREKENPEKIDTKEDGSEKAQENENCGEKKEQAEKENLKETCDKEDNKNKEGYRFPLWSNDFIRFLMANSSVIKKIEKMAFSEGKVYHLTDYDMCISKLKQSLNSEGSDVDSIMLEYIVERNFNYMAVQEWLRLLMSSPHDLKDILSVDIMMEVFKLPNVFSRRYYMRFILEAFDMNHYEKNYFSYHENPIRSLGMYMGKRYEGLSHQVEWVRLCKNFLQFMTELVFPVYERCFFLLFQDAVVSTGEANNWVLNGVDLLEKYVNDHAEFIQAGGFPEDEYKELKQNYGDRIDIPLDELLGYQNGAKEYRQLSSAEQKTYDLLIQKIIRNLPGIDNKYVGRKWDENYFDIRSDDNKENYARLFDCYMKALGIT